MRPSCTDWGQDHRNLKLFIEKELSYRKLSSNKKCIQHEPKKGD